MSNYKLSPSKRFIIHRDRECPMCGEYNATVKKTDEEGKPVLFCKKCRRWSHCEYKEK